MGRLVDLTLGEQGVERVAGRAALRGGLAPLAPGGHGARGRRRQLGGAGEALVPLAHPVPVQDQDGRGRCLCGTGKNGECCEHGYADGTH